MQLFEAVSANDADGLESCLRARGSEAAAASAATYTEDGSHMTLLHTGDT